MATAEVSYDGWLWTTSAQAPDVIERQYPVAYAYRGLSLDSEGMNRNVNVAIPTLAERQAADPFTPDDPDLLPGQTNVAAPDGPNNEVNTGYLWDAALRAESHGSQLWFLRGRDPLYDADTTAFPWRATRSRPAPSWPIPRVFPWPRTPIRTSAASTTPSRIITVSQEWEREFDTNYAKGGLPSLSLVRFMHDHTGNYDTRD